MHHSAIVVSDLARSISFYEKFFDAEVELSFEAGGPDVAALHGLDESLFTMAMLSVGGGRIEIGEHGIDHPVPGRFIFGRVEEPQYEIVQRLLETHLVAADLGVMIQPEPVHDEPGHGRLDQLIIPLH